MQPKYSYFLGLDLLAGLLELIISSKAFQKSFTSNIGNQTRNSRKSCNLIHPEGDLGLCLVTDVTNVHFN